MSGKTSNASKMKYNAKAYDRMELIVKKGNREKIKEFAESKGRTVNAYIKKLISDDMGIDL